MGMAVFWGEACVHGVGWGGVPVVEVDVEEGDVVVVLLLLLLGVVRLVRVGVRLVLVVLGDRGMYGSRRLLVVPLWNVDT